MSEVPDRNAASASAEASNPFAPIDYASRLKAPSRHTGAFHAMQPLQPGQLYGAAPWMSPPKPLASSPPPQESGEVPSGQGAPSFSAAFPPYTYPSPTAPAFTGESAPSASDIPPYLKRRPVLGRDAAHAEPPQEARVDVYSAADFQPPLFPDEIAAEPAVQSAAPPVQQHASHRSRRSRMARHQVEEIPLPDAAVEGEAAAPLADALPPLPEMPSGFSFQQTAWDASFSQEAPLFPAGGEPGAPYAPPFQPGAPYRPAPADDPASFSEESQQQPTDEADAFFRDAADEPSVRSEPPDIPAPELRDPFSPAVHAHAAPQEEASRVPPANRPGKPPPRDPAPPAPSSETDRPQRPPVRPARVAALIAAFMMLVFCLVQGSRILTDLARNEREMEDVREDFLERTGMELQSGAARVDLLPAGQTYAPSPSPVPTQAVQTPSPTPVIPIRENAIQSLSKRDTSNVQEVPDPTDTPSPRTRLTEYPGNPLKNVMESLLPLIEENGDVVGKLTIPGVLEEVVVQRNNTYYLTHNYRGSSSDAGAVFVDESCSFRSPPENLLLRGQAAIEGKVFAPLWQYATGGRDFVASATTAHLTTLYEEADYVLFAVIVASSNPSSPNYFNYAGYPSFVTDADMLSYIEAAREHSLYSFNVDVTASDRLLTLATLGSGTESLVLLFRQMR